MLLDGSIIQEIMDIYLLKQEEVDLALRYPNGRSVRLAKAGRIPHIILPDGEIRFDEVEIMRLLQCCPAQSARTEGSQYATSSV